MSLIKTVKEFPSPSKTAKQALLLCGYGNEISQFKHLTNTLSRHGYTVTALDFEKAVLEDGDSTLLPKLVEEVTAFAQDMQSKIGEPILLIGISLGSLLSFNILRRCSGFDYAILITGGDIARAAKNGLPDTWGQSYAELAKSWESINIYSDPAKLKDKHVLMILPTKDRLIDPSDVRREIAKQQAAGNDFTLIERPRFGHLGTIIEEVVLFPKRVIGHTKTISRR